MARGSILVVDDEPDICALVAETLESVGYPVVTAENGAEAMCFIDREMPRLIVLDMHMPLVEGRDLAAFARHRGCDAPIVVMTAGLHAQQAAEDIDADAYISKPFELNELISTVERLCA
jgi:two-component system, OmpR family, response regulator